MGDKMESEQSISGGSPESGSSSDSSSGSSEGEDDATETLTILGHTLELPQELCENYAVFKEFFSMKTWEALDEKHKDLLKAYLPTFKDNDEEEKERTVKMLLNFEPFHFASPLDTFYTNLRHGNYRPDIAKMRKFLLKARRKQRKHRMRSYYAKLLPEVLLSRERLLAVARAMPPGRLPSLPMLPPKKKNSYKSVQTRAKQRYFEELAAIRSEVGGGAISEDENYPEGPPEVATVRSRGQPGQSTDGNVSGTLGTEPAKPTSLECLKNVLAAHRARRRYRDNHPELNTAGITLEDIKQRVALVNGAKKLMFGGQKSDGQLKLKRGPKKDPDKGAKEKGAKKKTDQESVENKPLLPNIKIKCEQEESDSEASSFVDPVASPKAARKQSDSVEVKQEMVDTRYQGINDFSMEPAFECTIKQEPDDPGGQRAAHPVPIKLEDLDGIDMMALPVEIADDTGEVVPLGPGDQPLGKDEALTETTYPNFLSLVRALFPARAAHRASKRQLKARCAAVIGSPIAPLNTWYNLSEDWCAELDSALQFLAGERGPHPNDFVPYLQFIPETQMYQWIGAGRDGDATLGRLCEHWVRAASPAPPVPSLPPPKHPTSWVVRAPTSAELADFRRQERRRFAAAARPFTYAQFGYRSVVAPCARAPSSGAGHGALLAAERPANASLLTLVKDAVARLPNGEGTRHDILTLLKMSQWIAPCADQTLLNALTSTLDRLLTAKRDPVVKYDMRTSLWTYLHRNRSEEDWLAKTSGRRGKAAAAKAARDAARDAANNASLADIVHSPPHALELEVGACRPQEPRARPRGADSGSDSEVDVLCSSPPPNQLSSAQLLMRTTGSVAQVPPPTKQKGRLVAVSPQKAKHAQKTAPPHSSKQSNSASQSTKQANKKQTPGSSPKSATSTPTLMAQSAKQASVIAQLTKPPPKQNIVIQTKSPAAKPPVQSPKQSNLPKQQSNASKIIPVDNDAPKLQSIVFRQESKVVKQEHDVPKPDSIVPRQDIIVPRQDIIVPRQECIVPRQENIVPKQETIVPKQETKMAKPTSHITQEIYMPRQETNIPRAQNTKQDNAPRQSNSSKPTIISNIPVQHHMVPQASQPRVPNVPHQVEQEAPKVQKTAPTMVARSPLVKQRPLQKHTDVAANQTAISVPAAASPQPSQSSVHVHQTMAAALAAQSKVAPPQATRSLLIRAPAVQAQATAAAAVSIPVPAAQTPTSQRRGLVRVLSPAAPSGGKSLISPRALMQQNAPTAKKRTAQDSASGVTPVQSAPATMVASSAPVTPSSAPRTVQLAGGRTVQIAANQTVHLPTGQAVQLQLSSLQLQNLGSHVRLPSGQSSSPKTQSPPAFKTSQPSIQIPISSVHLTGQTVKIGGQTVQIAGQSMQLTGHTVKLPSGQSVQVASPSILPLQRQVQLTNNLQTVQLGQSVQNVQLPTQTVHLGGQTLQLPSGQTIQLASGQTIQLASGQTVQLGNAAKPAPARSQATIDSASPPIMAKLMANAQGQMVLEAPGGRQLSQGVRVLPPARLSRPLLLATGKPLHNIILQQSDGNAIRMTSTSGAAASSQTIVISNIGAQTVTTSTTSAPVLKLHQVNPLQQVKLAQGLKLQQPGGAGGVRGVVMEGQQLKLVGGRHVLARILRPAQQPPPH